jgi:hypothetical protein
MGVQSVAVLVSVMQDPEVAAGVRVRAASEVLGKLMQVRVLTQLEERLAAIEDMLERQGHA